MNKVDMVLEEWSASLRSKNRKIAAVRPNFEELFQRWHDLNSAGDQDAKRDNLLATYLPKAIKAHQPPSPVARESYKKVKHFINKSEKEYVEGWNKEIHDIATETFFEYFPNEVEADKKVYGNLGKAEYMHQRRLSSQYPILDTSELERRLHEKDDDLDLEDLKRALLGDGGKTNE